MKSLTTIFALILSVAATANESYHSRKNGRLDPFSTIQAPLLTTAGVILGTQYNTKSEGTSMGTSASLEIKRMAFKVTNDAVEYFQTGEMSVLLGSMVKKVMDDDRDLSEEDAVSIVLDFADQHI